MTFEEWSKNKKKKKDEQEDTTSPTTKTSSKTTSSAKTFEEWSKERSVNKVDTSYINNFINSANEYLKTAEEEYGTVGWSNADKTRAHRHNKLKDLNHRADRIRKWLEINQGNLDEETYKSLVDALDSYSSSASSVYDTFKNADDYYEQWDTEDAYNAYVKQQEEINAIKNSADFDAYVKKGTEVANPAWNETFDPVNIFGWKPFGEGKDVNNMVTFAETYGDKALAKEVAPSGITVNCVCPGVIDTKMSAWLTDQELMEIKEQTPIGRLGTPQEVAELIYFLSSDKADFITGQIITVDGGYIL
jgi:hypothetical protein